MKILLKILVSLIAAFGILLGLEQVFQFGLKHNRNFKLSFIQSQPINADLLIQGPCQSEWGIDPFILEEQVKLKAYNLSLVHSNFADNYVYLIKYFEHQKKPKVVILYVTPDSFAENGTNTFKSYQFASLVHDYNFKSTINEFDFAFVEKSRIPFLRYSYYSSFTFYQSMGGWLDYLLGRKEPNNRNGFVPPGHSYMRSENFRELSPENGIFHWSQLMEKYFLKIILLLQEKNIPLLVYEAPIYYKSVEKQKNRKTFLNKIDSLCNAYQIPFFKFDTLQMNYDRRNFFTTYNTTIQGNAIFNPLFCRILKDTLPTILAQQVK